MKAVCTVIVTHNGAPWIRRCLDSLAGGSFAPSLIVVDNASSDDTAQIVATDYPAVQLLRNEANLGFGVANNLGIRRAMAAGAEFVLLLNQDAYVLPDSVQQLLDFMHGHPEFGVVSPLHCSPDAEHVDARTLRGYLQTFASGYLSDACMGRASDHYPVRGMNAAAWLVRSEVFSRAGGFDPLFFMYGEDDDLLCRWQHHGVAFALLTACRIVHLRQSSGTGPAGFRTDVSRRAARRRSELLVLIKRPHFSAAHMLSVLLAEGWVVPLARVLITRDGREYLASQLAAWRVVFEFPRVLRHARLTAAAGPHFV